MLKTFYDDTGIEISLNRLIGPHARTVSGEGSYLLPSGSSDDKVVKNGTLSMMSKSGDWRFFTNKIPVLIEEDHVFKFKIEKDSIIAIDGKEYSLEALLQDSPQVISFENLCWISDKTSFESKGIKGRIVISENKLFIDYH